MLIFKTFFEHFLLLLYYDKKNLLSTYFNKIVFLFKFVEMSKIHKNEKKIYKIFIFWTD